VGGRRLYIMKQEVASVVLLSSVFLLSGVALLPDSRYVALAENGRIKSTLRHFGTT